MQKEIKLIIGKCRDCPHVTNSSKEHDCAFTSAPHPVIWYCKHKDRKAPFEERILHDKHKLDKYCPL